MAFAVGIGGQLRLKFFGTGEGPRQVAAGMGPETGRVAPVAHIADIKLTVGVAHLHLGLEMAVVHHARPQIVAQHHNARSLIEFQYVGRPELKRAEPNGAQQNGNC